MCFNHAGKPGPPSQAQATDVTNSCVTLSWQPPRHNNGGTVFAYTVEMSSPKDPKSWTVLTKSCQGNNYQVKHLQPSTEYLFRVRAENIHGVSKASRPSEVVETKMYDVDQQLYQPASEDKPRQPPRRRHSINLHLEGTVTSILNHTDIEVKTTSSREPREPKTSVSSDTESSGSFPGQEAEKDSFRSDLKTNSLQRDAGLRNSWQPSRKRSLPILLPGTRTQSLHKLRDSQTFPTSKARLGQATDSLKRREQRWKDRPVSDPPSTSSGSKEDLADSKSCSSKEESCADEDLKPKVEGKVGDETDRATSPWEKGDSVNQVSDGIMSAPLCDDIKMALYARSVPDSPKPWLGRCGEVGQADFRTLRSLLHSDDIIVKPTRSMPDMVVGAGSKKAPVSNTLSTIVDLEEEDESVRITTL